MNAGYVRLSRDDDKRNYVSIENQKLIINQYAADHGVVIDRWYEDDGISGYIFDRPGFQQMMADLDKDIDTVYVKDFSRLGRHNAKVLLTKSLGILENTDNPLKPYNIIKSKEEIAQLAKDYLPNLSPETTAKQLSDDYLHGISDDRRNAGNGI